MTLNGKDFDIFVETLDRRGGGWAEAFSTLLRRSDPIRRQRLLDAFPDQLKQFGPGSNFFRSTEEDLCRETAALQDALDAYSATALDRALPRDCVPF